MGMWQKVRNFILVSIIDHLLWSYVPVWAPTMLVTGLAYLQARPWDILAMMAIGTFALCSVGMFFFAQWRMTRTPKGKLHLGMPITSKVVPNPNDVPRITYIKLGMLFRNTAAFQMEFEIADVKCTIGNRIDRRKKEIGKRFIIDSGGTMAHIDNGIDLSGAIVPGGRLEGDFYIKVKYGHVGKLKFETQSAYAILFAFDEFGDIRSTDVTLIDPEAFLRGESNAMWQPPDSHVPAGNQPALAGSE
jgi:hypothetical protein